MRQKTEAEKITVYPINTGKDGRRRIYNFISLWWNYSLSPLFKNMFSMICRFASSVQAFFHVFMAGILFYGPKGRFFCSHVPSRIAIGSTNDYVFSIKDTTLILFIGVTD